MVAMFEFGIHTELLIKILLSIFLGGLIGLEREISHHPAGFRTNILICLGSTLFMFISYVTTTQTVAGVSLSLDPTRVAAGVVTGIGFLGAGVIFKKGANVKGLTTAASIWVVASIGLLVGSGLYFIAVVSTAAIVLILHIFHYLEKELLIYHELEFLKIRIKDKPGVKKRIEAGLKGRKIKISVTNFKRDRDELLLVYAVGLPRTIAKGRVTDLLMEIPEIIEAEWKDL